MIPTSCSLGVGRRIISGSFPQATSYIDGDALESAGRGKTSRIEAYKMGLLDMFLTEITKLLIQSPDATNGRFNSTLLSLTLIAVIVIGSFFSTGSLWITRSPRPCAETKAGTPPAN